MTSVASAASWAPSCVATRSTKSSIAGTCTDGGVPDGLLWSRPSSQLPQNLGAGGIHRWVAGMPSGCSRRICSIALASISTALRVCVLVDGTRINPA